jgi:hypothetical protein
MPVELVAEIEPVTGAEEVRDGWRGLLDFGERWTEADRNLGWPAEAPEVPVGQPLTYGCEVSREEAVPGRVRIRLLMIDEPRPVMQPGLQFTLRDGGRARATGRLL